MVDTKLSVPLTDLVLKEMDPALLLLSLWREWEAVADHNAEKIIDAATVSAFVHRNQTRKNRKTLPVTHYVEHPLRLAVRLVRWGCTEEDIIVAALLHDTVEDGSSEILEHYMNASPDAPVEEGRVAAISWLTETFGVRVGNIVASVTNPVYPTHLTREQRNVEYRMHVAEAIKNPDVFCVKFSDFVDNAVGLHHNGFNSMTKNLAQKYLPLIQVFTEGYQEVAEFLPLSPEGHHSIQQHLSTVGPRLQKLAEGE